MSEHQEFILDLEVIEMVYSNEVNKCRS